MQIEPGSEADGNASVVGVVPPPTSSVLAHAAHTVSASLAQVRAELGAKRDERDALNDEIRQLVADEDLLRRMNRLAETVSGNGDGPP